MAKQNNITPAQGIGSDDPKMIDAVVTQETPDLNPELLEQGVTVGETIPVPETETEPDVKTPEWVEQLLASNEAVIASNGELLKAISSFKCTSSKGLPENSNQLSTSVKELEVDPEAKYLVAQGKSFRDSTNFSLEYKEGDDVTFLGEQRLKALLNQNLIEEA